MPKKLFAKCFKYNPNEFVSRNAEPVGKLYIDAQVLPFVNDRLVGVAEVALKDISVQYAVPVGPDTHAHIVSYWNESEVSD